MQAPMPCASSRAGMTTASFGQALLGRGATAPSSRWDDSQKSAAARAAGRARSRGPTRREI